MEQEVEERTVLPGPKGSLLTVCTPCDVYKVALAAYIFVQENAARNPFALPPDVCGPAGLTSPFLPGHRPDLRWGRSPLPCAQSRL